MSVPFNRCKDGGGGREPEISRALKHYECGKGVGWAYGTDGGRSLPYRSPSAVLPVGSSETEEIKTAKKQPEKDRHISPFILFIMQARAGRYTFKVSYTVVSSVLCERLSLLFCDERLLSLPQKDYERKFYSVKTPIGAREKAFQTRESFSLRPSASRHAVL